MEAKFWHECWDQNQTGFHLAQPNPLLVKHSAALEPAGCRVLVPLCGKSIDLAWLAARGYDVLGVELSELAVRAFFDEQALTAQESVLGPFKRFRAGAIELLCGDFFALEREHIGDAAALYDRAALVALPEPMRKRYAAHLHQLLPASAHGLLVTFEYASDKPSGPPFSVPSAEVLALHGGRFAVHEIARADILANEPRFQARGLTALDEVVFALEPRATS